MQKRFLIWKNAKQAVLAVTLLLMAIGCINVFSASFVVAKDNMGSGYYFLNRYILFGAIGLGALYVVGWKLSYRQLLKQRYLWFFVSLSLLVYVKFFGVEVLGAKRWISLGFTSFQPSEAVKLAVVLFGAERLGAFLRVSKPPTLLETSPDNGFVWTFLLAMLVLLQPDMGTAAIIMGIIIVLYLLTGLHFKEVAVLGVMGLIGVILAIRLEPYRLERLKIWWDPWSKPLDAGYQMVQSLVSIGSGGFKGNQFGMGSGKFFFLPEPHTDFAFAIWCQEWGFIGAIALLLLFLILGMALYTIARDTKDEKGYLMVMGINFLVVGQAIANMAMVCGLFPVIGVPLSFISYGGTSLIVSLIAIGLVINVYNDETGEYIEASRLRPVSPDVLPFKKRGSR